MVTYASGKGRYNSLVEKNMLKIYENFTKFYVQGNFIK